MSPAVADRFSAHAGRRRELATLARYAIVGLTNTGIYLVLSGVLLALDVAPAPASVVGYAAGAGFSFVVNRAWTFRSGTARRHAPLRFGVVQLASLASVTGGSLLLTDVTGFAPLLAEVCVLPWVVVAAFVVNRNWVFGASN